MKIHPHKRRNTEPKTGQPNRSGDSLGKTRQNAMLPPSNRQQDPAPNSGKRKLPLFLHMLCLSGLLLIASIQTAISDETDSPESSTLATADSDDSLAVESLPLLPAKQPAPELGDGLHSTPDPEVDSAASPRDHATSEGHNPQAIVLLKRVLQQLVHGPAFHCKVRETVWTNDREVIGVGTYEQAGQGTGRYHLQVTMHDGSGRHRLQQISDGRLAWTRTEIASGITLRRVDVSRLDEWVGKPNPNDLIPPRYTVGAWVELCCRPSSEIMSWTLWVRRWSKKRYG